MNTVTVNSLWESLWFLCDLFSSMQHLILEMSDRYSRITIQNSGIYWLPYEIKSKRNRNEHNQQIHFIDRNILVNDFSLKCKFHERMVYIPNDLTWRMHSKIGSLLFSMHLYLIESIGKRPHHILSFKLIDICTKEGHEITLNLSSCYIHWFGIFDFLRERFFHHSN